MATWQQFEEEAPRLAAAVRARFEAHRHHVLATLRKDGSPRVSGTEARIRDGQLTLGSMPGAVKARDLRRDARFALHANPGDGSMDGGDAKVAGRAVEVADHAFRLELTEAVLTSVQDGERLLIQLWRPGSAVREIRRS
ncbi:pyridoxamine 5'-phosphate oxidase family protein [Streptomyces sp. RB6PN25]|uniref:Pyridoxamine 5'-phosphate oxidase family protein n=1 Tax=Streptomyces humicola TaxID=2953240 RepID=A0ABT1PZF9_9ACTN|nr:pyridoxamine 5'-phosphate oxidase family protein [Streptomyces humicola]MCQ4083069.1 pyridoxamine 5'-phosphate oxidase family protein [Streptomyces humicola]